MHFANNNTDGENLYLLIESFSIKCGYGSVSGLCRSIGISRTVLSELKSGRTKNLSLPMTDKIAKAFGKTAGEFIGYLDTAKEMNISVESIPYLLDDEEAKRKIETVGTLLNEPTTEKNISAIEQRYNEQNIDANINLLLKMLTEDELHEVLDFALFLHDKRVKNDG